MTLARPDRVRVQSGSISISWMSMAALAYVFEKYPYRWSTWRKTLLLQARLTVLVVFNRNLQVWERLAESEIRKNAIYAHITLFHAKIRRQQTPKTKCLPFMAYSKSFLLKYLSQIIESSSKQSIEKRPSLASSMTIS